MVFYYPDLPNCIQRTRQTAEFGVLPYFFLCTLFSTTVFYARSVDGSISKAEKYSDSPVVTTPCWHVEEFLVADECTACNVLKAKIVPECLPTGYVEKVNCPKSKRDEYKSCRSVEMEKTIFWKFVGGMMGASAAFALVVVYRQRTLDGRALEKVRKQIESI
ncbi:protein JTB [Ambystoma mexicanum]|uniref:protein JTB n=1 Tax=Ambystoma mexicanum TaxID=8296 RepID=UPI0037E71F4C